VAALREAHGALVQAGLLGDRVAAHIDREPRATRFDAEALGRLLADLLHPERLADRRGVPARADHVDPEVRRDVQAVLARREAVLLLQRRDVARLARFGTYQRQDRVPVRDVLVAHVT